MDNKIDEIGFFFFLDLFNFIFLTIQINPNCLDNNNVIIKMKWNKQPLK